MSTFWPVESVPETVVVCPYVRARGAAVRVTPAGAAVTVTVPFLFLFRGSTVENLPTLVNVNVYAWPDVSTGEVKGHVVQTTWWLTVSLFVQVTESPTWTLTDAGTKSSLLMSTVTASGSAAARSKRRADGPSARPPGV